MDLRQPSSHGQVADGKEREPHLTGAVTAGSSVAAAVRGPAAQQADPVAGPGRQPHHQHRCDCGWAPGVAFHLWVCHLGWPGTHMTDQHSSKGVRPAVHRSHTLAQNVTRGCRRHGVFGIPFTFWVLFWHMFRTGSWLGEPFFLQAHWAWSGTASRGRPYPCSLCPCNMSLQVHRFWGH